MAFNTDSLYIDRAVSGDGEALEVLIRRHQPTLARIIGRLTRDRDEVEDVLQETWIKAQRALRSEAYRHDGKFVFWLSRVARNVFTDRVRGRHEVTILENEAVDHAISPEASAMIFDLMTFLKRELALALGVDSPGESSRVARLQWLAFFYFYQDGFKVEEIVELLTGWAKRLAVTAPSYYTVNNWISGGRTLKKLVSYLLLNHPQSIEKLSHQVIGAAELTASEAAAWEKACQKTASEFSSGRNPDLSSAVSKIAVVLRSEIFEALHDSRKSE